VETRDLDVAKKERTVSKSEGSRSHRRRRRRSAMTAGSVSCSTTAARFQYGQVNSACGFKLLGIGCHLNQGIDGVC